MKLKNREFKKLDHQYEIIITTDANDDLFSQDDNEIPLIKFDFKFISDINNFEKGCTLGNYVLY